MSLETVTVATWIASPEPLQPVALVIVQVIVHGLPPVTVIEPLARQSEVSVVYVSVVSVKVRVNVPVDIVLSHVPTYVATVELAAPPLVVPPPPPPHAESEIRKITLSKQAIFFMTPPLPIKGSTGHRATFIQP
ncbi:MAG: hypothetical protein HZB29_00475 [Nitrospinae bacterium]|nr:hypothetical protein [Nitrospinota bacterium]